MNSPTDLAKMVPGFEFLQNLMKGASASLPGVQGFGQWVAPTLDPEELEKRIQELKTVQFWLEQNARLLGASIQALEVQRMTLSTLQTMNLPMADLRNALKARLPEAAPASASAPAPPPAPPPAAASASEETPSSREKPAAPAAIDPMQWWGALTQQFTEIAAKAMKDTAADAAGRAAGAAGAAGAAVKQGMAGAGKTLAEAATLPRKAAKAATAKATRAATPRKR
jgi:hypothetical protein